MWSAIVAHSPRYKTSLESIGNNNDNNNSNKSRDNKMIKMIIMIMIEITAVITSAIKRMKIMTETVVVSITVKESSKPGHNISRLFDVLPNFLFTTSETKRDY